MPEPRQLKEIFADAVELAEQDRAAFLDRECGGDAALRARIDELLKVHAAGDAFLGHPTASPQEAMTAAALPQEGPGSLIDKYKLLQLIGEGGFGAVYLAEERGPVVRKVALKIIKLGMDTRQVIARFEAERQALAMMDHPNIAKVLGAGATASGRPYFVMELVTGEPITAYCDRNGLSIDDRLHLFAQVCHAVQHAHQKGIIHRDIKPSNILVSTQDGRPFAKVIDFGIAKATSSGARLTDKTLFTEHRALIGTPEYMSPEQAEGSLDIDTRCDVYSLGVLLYELLTGAAPFDARRLRSAAWEEMLRIIREEEPQKPSTRLSSLSPSPSGRGARGEGETSLAQIAAQRHIEPARLTRLMRGDLDWIVMKCLEKNRSRRYETAIGLALDIERHLTHEPVEAGPPSRMYRMRKFVRRHRAGTVAAALVSLAILAGLGGTSWGILWALDERDRAEGEAGRADRETQEAKERAAETQQVADFQAGMLENIDIVAMGARIQSTLREQRRAALERQFVGEWPESRPRTAEEVADGLARFDDQVGGILSVDVARRVMAEEVLGRAAAAALMEFGGQPLVLAQIQDSIGWAYLGLGLAAQAAEQLRAAANARALELGENHPLVANSLGRLSEAIRELENYEDAETVALRSLSMRRRALGSDHRETASGMAQLASAQYSTGKFAESEALFREALAWFRDHQLDDDPDAISTMMNLGNLLQRRGLRVEAETLFREALDRRTRLVGEHHAETAITLSCLSYLLAEMGRVEEAEEMQRRALSIQRTLLGDEHSDVAASINRLALILEETGDVAEAERMYRELIAIERRIRGDRHPSLAVALNNLAVLFIRNEQLERALPLMEEALSISHGAGQSDSPDVAIYLHHVAEAKLHLGDVAGAEPLAAESVALYREHPDWSPFEFQHALTVLSEIHARLGRVSEAIAALHESLEVERPLLVAGSTEMRGALERVAYGLLRLGAFDDAAALFEEELGLLRAHPEGNGHTATMVQFQLGDTLRLAGRDAEAEAALLDVAKDMRAEPDWNRPLFASTLRKLAELYATTGRTEEGIAAASECIDVCRETLGAESAELASALATIGSILLELKAPSHAEPLLRESLSIRDSIIAEGAPDSWLRSSARSLVGESVAAQGRFAEAEPLLLEGWEGLGNNPNVPAPTPGRTDHRQRAIERLISLYDAWDASEPGRGYDAKAAEWRKRLEEFDAPRGG